MGEHTSIEWCSHTFNPWIGCAAVSPGCDNCYAETLAHRRGWHDWQNSTPRKTMSDDYWRQPLRWNRRAEAARVRERVFCASLADVFDPQAPHEERHRLWRLVAETPHLDWLILTKRPNLAERFLPRGFDAERWPNVWLGFSAEDQEHFDLRWPYVAELDAAVRFVSYEPMLGPLSLLKWAGSQLPDWLIWGGESGPGARPCKADWARLIVAECVLFNVAVFGKQWGSYSNNPLIVEDRLSYSEVASHLDPPEHGKGGAHLDGELYREMPVRVR